jgi:GT2 family glycosyltransferase
MTMVDVRTIFDEPHHQSLEFLATKALAEDNIAAAFKLADRRCRILPLPEPHCYLLRGEASYRLGDKAAAIADVAKALEIAPDNVVANRRMLTWADGTQQSQAARAIISQDANFASLRKAIQTLHDNGQRFFARVVVLDETVEGWAVWEGEAPLKVSIADGAEECTRLFEPDTFHPLGEYGHATNFSVRRPKSTIPQVILLAIADRVFYSTRTAGNDSAPSRRVFWPRPRTSRTQQVTVIVPVYGDYDATRVCIDALLDELRSCDHRAMLVNDATPDTRIARYLADVATNSRVEVIVNPRTRGFVGSINCSLERTKGGDVILLNSDTIVPRGFINRLAAAARSAPDIGTVTPLSNNGEFVSFPMPNKANALGSRHDVEMIDAVAAKANADIAIDIPSGIGFCLYITRACLDRVGSLSDEFAPGYLEDADFCLRIREHGFRNICLPSVYVGHAGSKSFGQEKRSLVVRNLRVLETRFPQHRSECAAFMAADPLRIAREAIERTAARVAAHPRLLITGTGVVGAAAHQRAREVASAAEPVLILEVRYQANGAIVDLKSPAEAMPQSLQFNLSRLGECEALVDFLKSNEPSRIEFLDPTNTPFRLVDLLFRLKIPYDLFMADAGFLGRHNEATVATAVQSLRISEPAMGGEVRSRSIVDRANWTKRWRQIAEGAQWIIVPCAHAEAFAASVLPQRSIAKIDRAYESRSRKTRKRRKTARCHLGFVPVRCCAGEQWLINEIARQLGKIRPDISITVIGAALDDIDLMRSSNVFVTGAVDPEEFEHLIDVLDVGNLFVSTTRPLFAHPILSIVSSFSLPTGYFDWSRGHVTSKKTDLPLDPRSPLDDLIGALSQWMPRQ